MDAKQLTAHTLMANLIDALESGNSMAIESARRALALAGVTLKTKIDVPPTPTPVISYANGHPTCDGRELCSCGIHDGPCCLPDGRSITGVRVENTLNRAFNEGVLACIQACKDARSTDVPGLDHLLKPIVDLPDGNPFGDEEG